MIIKYMAKISSLPNVCVNVTWLQLNNFLFIFSDTCGLMISALHSQYI